MLICVLSIFEESFRYSSLNSIIRTFANNVTLPNTKIDRIENMCGISGFLDASLSVLLTHLSVLL